MSTALHAVLLAAGASSRFEGIKQLARFRGESLLRSATIAATQLLGSRVTVVLGANALFGEIRDIAGDHGAKSLLLRYFDEVVRVPSPEAAIDVDTPAELAAL